MYVIMETMCPPGYHHNGFVETHALGHMMYGSYAHLASVRFEHSVCHESLMTTTYIYIYIYIYICMYIIYIIFIYMSYTYIHRYVLFRYYYNYYYYYYRITITITTTNIITIVNM